MRLAQYIAGLVVATALLSTSGCTKDSGPISETPEIKFVSMTPNPAVKYQDKVKIIIEYTDGDGDLGENTANIYNLFVTDSRNSVTSRYRINQLAPDGATIAIKGTLSIELPNQGFVDDNNTTETATFSIYVTDRAGHQSNTIQTDPLVINQ